MLNEDLNNMLLEAKRVIISVQKNLERGGTVKLNPSDDKAFHYHELGLGIFRVERHI